MNYQILFLDIDGTILTPEGTYTHSTKEAVKQVQARGIDVFFATGRGIHEIADLAVDLNVDAFIGYNGAQATYQGQTLVDASFSADLLEAILNKAMKHNDQLVLYTDDCNYFTHPDSPVSQQFQRIFQLRQNAPWDSARMHDVLSITLIHAADPAIYESTDPILNLAPVNVSDLTSSYDILRKDVHKGEAVRKTLEHMDIPAQNAIAIGDGMNDMEMMQIVGTGIAMGNAHPDLFQYCSHHTTDVDNGGVHKALKMIGAIE